MVKIITITCHTALDYRIEIDQLIPGRTISADHSVCYAGGKGTNVGKAAAALGMPVHLLGFVGKQSSDSFVALSNELLTTDFTFVEGTTRTNLTLNDSNSETHIRTQGFSITEVDRQRLLKQLGNCLEADDIVIIAGSLPPGAPDDFLQTLIDYCHQRSAWIVLDSNGTGLQLGIQARPNLCKPNLAELEALSGCLLTTTQSIIDAAKALIDSGCAMVVVSRGEPGVIAINDQEILIASINTVTTPILGTVGCGDALVAGMAVARLQDKGFVEMLRLGVACATANLATPEPGIIEPERVEFYKSQVQIKVARSK